MKKHFNFIEIGTSDFHTLIEQSTDDTVGLSIEPIEYYLNRLPNKKNVKKINAAVSNENGEIEIYLIEPEDIIKNNLPIWVKGCNSVNKPHEFAKNKLGPDFYDSIVKIKKVPTINWNTIINENEVGSVGYVKIDTEGYDHVILKNYFEYCEKNPSLYANKIMFEYNESSNKEELEKLIKNLPNYTIERLEEDIVLHKVSGLFYKGKKIADRGCIINLPERTDRKISIEKTLTDLNFSGFEFVDGVKMESFT
jgi:FkbM family methyltransferase